MTNARAILKGITAIDLYLKEHENAEMSEAHEVLQELLEREYHKEFLEEREAER